MSDKKTIHPLHVEIPIDLWREYKKVVPESGITSLIIKRLLQSYVNAVKGDKTIIEITKLIL